MMLSCRFLTPSQPSRACWITCWYISGAQLTPNISRLYLKSPLWVTKVVIGLDSSLNSTWWNAHFMSSLLKTVLPFRSWRISSTVGIGCGSLTTALFACLMLTQRRRSPFGLGTRTTGEIQGVGPSAFVITSSSTNSSSFSSNLPLKLKGTRRTGWATGLTFSLSRLRTTSDIRPEPLLSTAE